VVTLAIQNVSVWLDKLAPQCGAFAHALEWAARLRLPLRAFAPAQPFRDAEPADGAAGDKLRVCEAACSERGVPWGVYLWRSSQDLGIKCFLLRGELYVFGDTLSAGVKQDLMTQSLYNAGAPLLVCPHIWRPVSRVLVVQQQRGLGSAFLDAVAQICRHFDATPIVLTVARTEREAQERQYLAEDTFAAHHLAADFDFLVGYDLATAVTRVAQWRRCSHVFLERPETTSWWQRFSGDPLKQLVGLTDSLTLLALPGSGVVAVDGTQEQASRATIRTTEALATGQAAPTTSFAIACQSRNQQER